MREAGGLDASSGYAGEAAVPEMVKKQGWIVEQISEASAVKRCWAVRAGDPLLSSGRAVPAPGGSPWRTHRGVLIRRKAHTLKVKRIKFAFAFFVC